VLSLLLGSACVRTGHQTRPGGNSKRPKATLRAGADTNGGGPPFAQRPSHNKHVDGFDGSSSLRTLQDVLFTMDGATSDQCSLVLPSS
jgi:hypothetical protein